MSRQNDLVSAEHDKGISPDIFSISVDIPEAVVNSQ